MALLDGYDDWVDSLARSLSEKLCARPLPHVLDWPAGKAGDVPPLGDISGVYLAAEDKFLPKGCMPEFPDRLALLQVGSCPSQFPSALPMGLSAVKSEYRIVNDNIEVVVAPVNGGTGEPCIKFEACSCDNYCNLLLTVGGVKLYIVLNLEPIHPDLFTKMSDLGTVRNFKFSGTDVMSQLHPPKISSSLFERISTIGGKSWSPSFPGGYPVGNVRNAISTSKADCVPYKVVSGGDAHVQDRSTEERRNLAAICKTLAQHFRARLGKTEDFFRSIQAGLTTGPTGETVAVYVDTETDAERARRVAERLCNISEAHAKSATIRLAGDELQKSLARESQLLRELHEAKAAAEAARSQRIEDVQAGVGELLKEFGGRIAAAPERQSFSEENFRARVGAAVAAETLGAKESAELAGRLRAQVAEAEQAKRQQALRISDLRAEACQARRQAARAEEKARADAVSSGKAIDKFKSQLGALRRKERESIDTIARLIAEQSGKDADGESMKTLIAEVETQKAEAAAAQARAARLEKELKALRKTLQGLAA